jgi:hypothetical protein
LNFARIYGDTILGNGVPQEPHTLQPEFTFGELSIKLMISQTLKDNSEMFGMSNGEVLAAVNTIS